MVVLTEAWIILKMDVYMDSCGHHRHAVVLFIILYLICQKDVLIPGSSTVIRHSLLLGVFQREYRLNINKKVYTSYFNTFSLHFHLKHIQNVQLYLSATICFRHVEFATLQDSREAHSAVMLIAVTMTVVATLADMTAHVHDKAFNYLTQS